MRLGLTRIGAAVTSALLAACSLGAADVSQPTDALGMSSPAYARILKIIHSWPDSPEAQANLINSLLRQGFGGVVCNVSFNDYLVSDAKWKAFAQAVESARKAGLTMWLYDEKGYPSAAAGGLVLKNNPEWQARGLLVVQTNATGGAVSLPLPPGKLITAGAYPVTGGALNLQAGTNLAALAKNQVLHWIAPTGNWRVLAFTETVLHEGTHADMSLSDHIPYPNLLQAAPTQRFIDVTHAEYVRRLQGPLNKWFVSTFTDEPSLMSLFLKRMPYHVLPWAPEFPAEFSRRRGLEIIPLLPGLVAEAGSAGRKARYQFWKTVGELVSENFFGQIQDWCRSNSILSGGHLLMEENLVNQVPLYGDFFGCLRRLDAPSIDCLTSVPEQVPWSIAKVASSAAALNGARLVMCETSDHSQRYRPPGDKRPVQTVTKHQIRGTCNRLMVSGVTSITSYYSFAGLSDAVLRELNDWVGQCSSLLLNGHPSSRIAVLYPTESLWTTFIPGRHLASEAPAASRIEGVFHNVSEMLFNAGWDFAYLDSKALATAHVENGVLMAGNQSFAMVILPAIDTMPLRAWQNLSQLVSQGGSVIAAGALPRNSETDFPSMEVERLGEKMFRSGQNLTANRHTIFLPRGQEAMLPACLEMGFERSISLGDKESPLRYSQYRVGGDTLFFVINDSSRQWSGNIGFPSAPRGEKREPGTAKTTPIINASNIALELQPYGAVFFQFPGELAPKVKPGPAVLPIFETRPLKTGEPRVSRGEFVKDQAVSELTSSATHFDATITKSDVDTFLFARYEPLDAAQLQQADALEIITSVNSSQRTPAELLLILHEKTGADYLAPTGRSLAEQGSQKTLVPLSRLRLAGWSQDANDRLDKQEISEIRVGWGGYYGVAGENVSFSVEQIRYLPGKP